MKCSRIARLGRSVMGSPIKVVFFLWSFIVCKVPNFWTPNVVHSLAYQKLLVQAQHICCTSSQELLHEAEQEPKGYKVANNKPMPETVSPNPCKFGRTTNDIDNKIFFY